MTPPSEFIKVETIDGVNKDIIAIPIMIIAIFSLLDKLTPSFIDIQKI